MCYIFDLNIKIRTHFFLEEFCVLKVTLEIYVKFYLAADYLGVSYLWEQIVGKEGAGSRRAAVISEV